MMIPLIIGGVVLVMMMVLIMLVIAFGIVQANSKTDGE